MTLTSFGTGFAMGYGAGFFSREAIPLAKEILAPIARVTVKTSVQTFERFREGVSKVGEAVEDIIAEVKDEMKKKRRPKKRLKTKAASTSRIERAA